MANKNPWESFAGEEYRIQNLGRPAIFFIPSKKLGIKDGKKTVEDRLNAFLQKRFGAFTISTAPYFGAWHNGEKISRDECRLYEVSFVGTKRIKLLFKVLARLARKIEEECIYFKAGEDTCLIYPTSSKKH
jgi:hypothetical protein